jgi:pimeloyl-ACP methyl ester carboxylesterase
MSLHEESRFFTAPDGLRLHVRVTRPAGARNDLTPVICLPGLSRNHRDFSALAAIIAEASGRTVLALDYRGRGLSARDPNWQNYTLQTEAADLLSGLAALAISDAHFVGTSRGGLILHLLAAMRPGVMASVTLNDVGPVIGETGMAQIKAGLNAMPQVNSWKAAENHLQQVHGKAFPALGEADFARMARAVFTEDAKGVLRPDFDPALLNILKALNFDAPLPTLWPQFIGLRGHPLLVLRGENSQLLTPDTLQAMKIAAPGMVAHVVPGQGHAPFLETSDLPKRLMAHFAAADRKRAAH